MIRSDFLVDWNDDKEILSEAMLCSAFLERRVKQNMPTVIVICAKSGQGKSYFALKLADILYRSQGIDLNNYLRYVECYTPLDYTRNLRLILNKDNLETKDLNIVVIDEAREIVDATKWQSFVTRAISEVNALSRGIKPMVFIIVTQSLKDVAKSVRATMDFYITVERPYGHPVQAKIWKIYIDDSDIEKVTLKRKRLSGNVRKDGVLVKTILTNLECTLPRLELAKQYEKMQFDAKFPIIMKRFNELDRSLRKDFEGIDYNIRGLVDWYTKPENKEALALLFVKVRGKLVLKEDVQRGHNLTKDEAKTFTERVSKKLKESAIEDAVSIPIE